MFRFWNTKAMTPLLARLSRAIYRKEPISGFILLFGLTNGLLGGFEGRWSLFSIGLIISVTGILMRWLQAQKVPTTIPAKPSRYRLPPSTSAIPLPTLTSSKKPHR